MTPKSAVLSVTRLAVLASCSAAFTGCSVSSFVITPALVPVSGNWQISSPTSPATLLPSLSGAVTSAGTSVTAILHSNGASSCVSPTTSFTVTGSVDANNQVVLTNPNLLGGVLSITGTVAPDGRSLLNPTYQVVGGSCAFSAIHANAQMYTPISGIYTGTFVDGPAGSTGNTTIVVVATLAQSPNSTTNGNFTLYAANLAFGGTDCFVSGSSTSTLAQVSVVTGGSFNFIYTDLVFGNSVTVVGTVSLDGTTLTITNWTLTGATGNVLNQCNGQTATGTGTLMN